MRKRIDVLWMDMTCRWLRYISFFIFVLDGDTLLYCIIPDDFQ
jgi:hypothetical protein